MFVLTGREGCWLPCVRRILPGRGGAVKPLRYDVIIVKYQGAVSWLFTVRLRSSL